MQMVCSHDRELTRTEKVSCSLFWCTQETMGLLFIWVTFGVNLLYTSLVIRSVFHGRGGLERLGFEI